MATKVKVKGIEYNLEDKDATLIITLQELTKTIEHMRSSLMK